MVLKAANEALKETANDEEIARFAYIDLLAYIATTFTKYRTQHKLTQKDLAKKLGISQVMISRIENGEWNLSIQKLNEYIKKLNGTLTIKIEFSNVENEIKAVDGGWIVTKTNKIAGGS